MRRLQGDSLVSVQALDTTSLPNYKASTLGWNTNVVYTKPGNGQDLAVHGLL